MSRESGAPSGEGYLPNMVTMSSSCANALTERQSLTRRKGSARYGPCSARAHRAFRLSRRSDRVKVDFRCFLGGGNRRAELVRYSFLPNDYVAVKNLAGLFSLRPPARPPTLMYAGVLYTSEHSSVFFFIWGTNKGVGLHIILHGRV